MSLIVPRKKLIVPSGGVGINPNHPAYSPRLRYVGVPLGKSFVNLLNGVGATIAAGTPIAQVSPIIGAGVNFNAASSRLTTGGGVVETPVRGVTMAAILIPLSTSVSFGTAITTGTRASGDHGIVMDSGTFQMFYSGAGHVGSSITIPAYVANRPYFVAFCRYSSSALGNIALVEAVTDLLTGEVWIGTASTTSTLTAPSAATYTIGGQSSSGQSQSIIAALMHSADAITVQDITAWANDPWSLWYPQAVTKTIFSGIQVVQNYIPPGNGKGGNNGKGNGKGGGKGPPSSNTYDPYGIFDTYYAKQEIELRQGSRRFYPIVGSSFNVIMSDTGNVTESLSAGAIFNASGSDTLTATDIAAVGQISSVSFSDTGSVSESLSAITVFTDSLIDNLTAVDSVSTGAIFAGTISDLMSISENLTVAAILSDSITDTSNATDTVSVGSILLAVLSDALSSSDSLSVITAFSGAVADALNVVEQVSAQQYAYATLDDPLTAADNIDGTRYTSAAFQDILTVADQCDAIRVVQTILQDALDAQDTTSAGGVLQVSLADVLNVIESTQSSNTFIVTIEDVLTVTDRFGGTTKPKRHVVDLTGSKIVSALTGSKVNATLIGSLIGPKITGSDK